MNTNKIDLIKAEVARIQLYTQSEVLKQVLDYIDEVPKEPVKIKKGCKYRCLCDMINKDTGNIAFIGGKIYLAPEDNTLVSEENGWCCDTSENASNFELIEEPQVKESAKTQHVNKTCKESDNSLTQEDAMTIRKEWFDHCKESWYNEGYIDGKYNRDRQFKEPVSESLEKAAAQDVCEVVNCCSATGIPNDHIPSWVQDAMINEFIHGAKWQKEQMMAKAIDAKLLEGHLIRQKGVTHPLHVGDKVKVIVIKED